MYFIFFKDVDPDTGNLTQTGILCFTHDEKHAEFIIHCVSLYEADPNREYFIVPEAEISEWEGDGINVVRTGVISNGGFS